MRWALAFLVLALLSMSIAVRLQPGSASKSIDLAKLRTVPARVESAPSPEAANGTRMWAKRARMRKSLPRKEQFPASTPLSGEERLLLKFVNRDPAEAGRVFADLEKRTLDALQIEAVEIKPLETDDAH